MRTNRVYNKDCVKGMRSMPEGSVDLAFADPPFNIGYTYDVYEDQLAADEYLDWTRQWGAALVRALKPAGSFWLAIGDDFAAELKMIFQRELKLTCRSWVIWYYTFGVNCTKKFSRSHTHLFHFVKDPKEFTFNADAVRVPSARQLVYADARANAKGRLPDDTWVLRPQDLPSGFQPQEDTWYFPRVCGTFKERAGWHGCQMPEQLLGRIIKSCSNQNELILDPFGGSGTTFVVAKKLGREFVGFELSDQYAKYIQSRLRTVSVGDALAGAAEPTVSAPPTAKGKRRTDKKRNGERRKRKPVVVPVQAPTWDEPHEVDRGIVEAFVAARNGFPVDRVIADPDLNARFAEACTRLGLPGDVAKWNHRLMGLRKTGHFKELPRSKVARYAVDEAEFEKYKFACEIAMEHFRAGGDPLDHVLCDPQLAKQFDEYVQSMIPEQLSSLKIRWFALRLRKRAGTYKKQAAELADHVDLPTSFARAFELDPAAVPAGPALYWLQGAGRHLYVGETGNLRERLEVQFSDTSFDFWGVARNDLELGYQSVDRADIVAPNQAVWIGKLKPEGNLATLAFAS